jgi:hypothetical protein
MSAPERHPDCPDWEIVYDFRHPDAGPGGMQVNSGDVYFRWHLEGQEPGPWLRWHGMKRRLVDLLRFTEPPGKAGWYRPSPMPSAAEDAAYLREWAEKSRAVAADWRKRAEFKEERGDHDTAEERAERAAEHEAIAGRLESIAARIAAQDAEVGE